MNSYEHVSTLYVAQVSKYPAFLSSTELIFGVENAHDM